MTSRRTICFALLAAFLFIKTNHALAEDTCCAELLKRIEKLEQKVHQQANKIELQESKLPPDKIEIKARPPAQIGVSSRELALVLENLPKHLSEYRSVPYFREGKMIGERLFAIRQGSIVEKYGLKNGDILLEVDGKPVDSHTDLGAVLFPANPSDKIQLRIERNGKEMTYPVPVKKE